MPGPFPGMDPYLENPALFPAVHQSLITFLWTELNAQLPSHYVANIGERVFVTDINERERPLYPDVFVVQTPRENTERGGVAVAVAPPETETGDDPMRISRMAGDRREVFIEIVPVGGEGEVITLIEVLSPANKSHGTRGHNTYIEKQKLILESDTHLIEIDLLRDGLHTVAADRDEIAAQAHFDYCICLSRAYGSAAFEVWARTVRERLPRFRVPLKADDKDIIVDLQALFDHCYEAGNFARRIHYQNEPTLPLRVADAEWADALLREKGLRH